MLLNGLLVIKNFYIDIHWEYLSKVFWVFFLVVSLSALNLVKIIYMFYLYLGSLRLERIQIILQYKIMCDFSCHSHSVELTNEEPAS